MCSKYVKEMKTNDKAPRVCYGRENSFTFPARVTADDSSSVLCCYFKRVLYKGGKGRSLIY